MNWFKQTLANVAGTQEPEYGPSAMQSVAVQAQSVPFTELSKDDLRWKALESTGIRTTCQFNSKIFNHEGPFKHLWCSDSLNNYGFDEEQYCFYADNLAVELNSNGTSFTIKSAVSEDSIVNITLTRAAPGFQIGKDGTSYFGTDPSHPWGSMRHVFWPRCDVEGSIITKEKKYDMRGRAMFVHALQGMKPHHAAARWNFINCQTPTYSAVMMEFTTPASYGNTVVNVSALAKDDEIISAGASSSAKHTATNKDSENDWPEPKSVSFEWNGKTRDGRPVVAHVTGSLGPRLDRVDVLAHIPGFVKTIVGGVVGTKPFIYQYCPTDRLRLKIKIGDIEAEEEGILFSEATFIS
ncbi:hypothetical protein EPUS_07474 [Endocarpon pusillum Z07020]|uniref:Survival factor 1 n=1 Tax=Endocarpon pusillum (strain Z07020 / HMAS-L-300199) TaxID=1263415 RepID=U1GLD4_ENDPU|nr:uncharacterized protein EPUS_07474 [Endocarpon pusillum Z07020]ERF72681.1 hypothetical protein EPUS_07474 [Endocarpon pusillum Z07020]